MIMGYELYRNISQASKISNEQWKKDLTSALVDPGTDQDIYIYLYA